MRFLSFIFILFFAGAALFGVTGMVLHMDEGGLPCATPALGGAICPVDQVLFAIHHLETYEFFSRAAPTFAFLLIIILILILAERSLSFAPPKPTFKQHCFRPKGEYKPIHSDRLTRWLSLFELSPSL